MVSGRGLTSPLLHQLRQLATLYGVQSAYFDVAGRRRRAAPEALLATLSALGAPVEHLRDVPNAVREHREAAWRRGCEPVVVAWDGRPALMELHLPATMLATPLTCRLQLENGEVRRWTVDAEGLATGGTAQMRGRHYVAKRLAVPGTLPWGYHRFTIRSRGRSLETLIIAAPRRAFTPDGTEGTWGVFLPLYALRARGGWGTGDLSNLDDLMNWVSGLGGGVVSTLPLLASFLDEPFDPSPYVPASRLFWNEFFLDVTRSPEFRRCPKALALLRSPRFQRELAELRASSLVDHRRAMRLKRRVLEELARCFFAGGASLQAPFRRFAETHPLLADYAGFRAVCDRRRTPWQEWPARLRDGVLRRGDFDEEARRYHLYVQWLADEHLRALSEKARRGGPGLFLDLPLGAHTASYDVWRERDAFALNVSGGAPPDAFFTRGQDWGFPPLHPHRIREQGYRYYIAAIRHQLRHASILRIDHVMGFHRLFWIPRGLEARQGLYVRYAAEEFYAIMALESQRHRSIIVGEDLGTVPPSLRRSMAQHNIRRTYVVQFEVKPRARRVLRPISPNALGGLNTHDMPPFAAFWQGLDIRDRRLLRLLDTAAGRRERKRRLAVRTALVSFLQRGGWLAAGRARAEAVLRALLRHLAASPARIVIVNLEDLWLERHPQNVPGTGRERPNWRRKARYAFETFSRATRVLAALREVNRQRKRSTGARP